jgi:asparagine synthase (glutamine-hydrolysing)
MCGIIGVASRNAVANRDWLIAGRDALRHRGPDDEGVYWSEDGRVGFGHRRLSIIDLSPLGHQPMASPERDLWLSYNGEIYNYRELKVELEGLGHSFRSHSDTEVVLAAYRQWGGDFVKRLDGMFALALHDVRTGQVILARDRAGEKPLFYRLHEGELRFASELKGLFADPTFPRVVDLDAFDCYLALGYVPGERCLLQGVNKLPPGHALVLNLASGKATVGRYWEVPAFDPSGTADEQELVDELEKVLEGAVRRQLVADVPVGLLLSGGVDSSLITALAVRGGGKLKTYTVGMKEYSAYDETEHAALIANHFGTDHTVLEAGEVHPDLLQKLARQYDEPIIDSSMIPTYLVSREIRQHCKVAIGGDGGDELFGGYMSASYMARLQQMLSLIPLWPRRLAAAGATHVLPIGFRGRALIRTAATDVRKGLPPVIQFEQLGRRRLLGKGWGTVAEGIRSERTPNERNAVERMTRFDFANYMAEDILVKVDRASMLTSLEVRAPFLDRSVIEFAYRKVPTSLKATPQARKLILRRLSEKILPPGFNSARKQGFTIPLDRWLRAGPWREHFREVLLDPSSTFARSEVEQLFRRLDRGKIVREQLFGLALFELWRREHNVSVPAY